MIAPPVAAREALAYFQTGLDNIEKRTGVAAAKWVERVRAQNLQDRGARSAWLKQVHGFGTNAAWFVAMAVDDPGMLDTSEEKYFADAAEYVAAMFAGARAHWRPLYDALLNAAARLGADVTIAPCQTNVPIRRRHAIAHVKVLASRIELGLALGPAPATPRLLSTGGFEKKDRITHKVLLTGGSDLDAEVCGWLKRAYTLDGPAK
ncbi:hypothetical protein BH11PLA1_BH11PLA1_11410 [soil metagenome]